MKEIRKAIVAALIAGLAVLVPAAQDGIDLVDVLGSVAAALGALGVVWAVPNAPADSRPKPPPLRY